MGEGEAMQLEPLEVGLEERSRSTIRVLTLTHHMGEGEAMRLEPLEGGPQYIYSWHLPLEGGDANW